MDSNSSRDAHTESRVEAPSDAHVGGAGGAPESGGAHRAGTHAESPLGDRWSPERVLASDEHTVWRERALRRSRSGAFGGASGLAHRPIALERAARLGLRQRFTRAAAVPLLAAATVFVSAVVIAIIAALLQQQPAAQASTEITEAGLEAGSAVGEVERAVSDRVDTADDPGAGTSTADVEGGAGNGSEQRVLFVHVVGEVARPGVVELAPGSRVADALQAAGGATGSAELSAVNLARAVVDGEQILVPTPEQVAAGEVSTPHDAAPGAAASDATPGAGAGGGTGSIDLNTADAAVLETLPRIGPALAQRIIEWRDANGGFESADQLLEVTGIGQKTFEGLQERVTVR